MQLRVYAGFKTEELRTMSDEDWVLQLCHLAKVRQGEKVESLNEAIKFENIKRSGG